jgi:hypothetical protein
MATTKKRNGDARAKDFLDGAVEVFCHGPRPHDLSNLTDVVKGDVTVVLDVLGLVIVALEILQGLDDESNI